eukprot:scaffold608_cov144-Skeletonema_menzelii.AAC.6
MPVDLLHPTAEQEARTHKLKRLVQSPNSFFMDIKCPGCFQITTVFSHAQTVVLCGSCNVMLCQPTGGRARLTEGCSYRKKGRGETPLLIGCMTSVSAMITSGPTLLDELAATSRTSG